MNLQSTGSVRFICFHVLCAPIIAIKVSIEKKIIGYYPKQAHYYGTDVSQALWSKEGEKLEEKNVLIGLNQYVIPMLFWIDLWDWEA